MNGKEEEIIIYFCPPSPQKKRLMKIAIIDKENHIEIQDMPIPQIDADKVLVKVSSCGVCGSDLAAFKGSGYKKYPYSPGHEFCGVIEKKGESVIDLNIGQRIVINPNLGCGECEFCKTNKPNLCDSLKSRPIKSNGGFAEYVSLDYRMVYKLPDKIPDDIAPFIEPFSCGIYAAETLEATSTDHIAVFGAGMMGLLTALALKSIGADILIIEPCENRSKSIKDILGISVMAPSELANSAIELDGVVDCSGNGKAIAQAIQKLKKRGRLVLAGLAMNIDDSGISLVDVTTKELEIKGVWLNPYTFRKAMDLTEENIKLLSSLKTEKFKLDHISRAFEKAINPSSYKVIVDLL